MPTDEALLSYAVMKHEPYIPQFNFISQASFDNLISEHRNKQFKLDEFLSIHVPFKWFLYSGKMCE